MPLPDPIARALVQARETKGLSQREAAKRSGLTQAQISKVETGSADLTVSSLTELARALDLEVALVPFKLVPALEGLSRSVSTGSRTSPEVAHQLKRLKAAAQSLLHRLPHLASAAELVSVANALPSLSLTDAAAPLIEETAHQVTRAATQKRMLTSAADDVASMVSKLKNLQVAAVLAAAPELPKLAYTLDDADE